MGPAAVSTAASQGGGLSSFAATAAGESAATPTAHDNRSFNRLRALADKAEQLSDELIGLLRDSPNQDIELDAWVQAKITKASDYMTSVYDYMMYSEKED